jgi:hypothetical protein
MHLKYMIAAYMESLNDPTLLEVDSYEEYDDRTKAVFHLHLCNARFTWRLRQTLPGVWYGLGVRGWGWGHYITVPSW